MQVDSNSTFYIKAQETNQTHVDMWTHLSTSASNLAGPTA